MRVIQGNPLLGPDRVCIDVFVNMTNVTLARKLGTGNVPLLGSKILKLTLRAAKTRSPQVIWCIIAPQ